MTYKIIKTTDGKMRGQRIEIIEDSIIGIINQIGSILEIEVDSINIQYPYIQINNANYTIVMKEVN